MKAWLQRPLLGLPISQGEAIFWVAMAPLLGGAIALGMAALP